MQKVRSNANIQRKFFLLNFKVKSNFYNYMSIRKREKKKIVYTNVKNII